MTAIPARGYAQPTDHPKKGDPMRNQCGYQTSDGNQDDPSYAYCGHLHNHAGDHGDWQV